MLPAATIPEPAPSSASTLTSVPNPLLTLDGDRSGFAVRFGDQVSRLAVLGVFAMPGQTIHFTALPDRGASRFRCAVEEGALATLSPRDWRWTAPQSPGLYPLEVSETSNGDTLRFNIFVMVPFDHERTELNRFRLGRYRAERYRGSPFYSRPPGFVEVLPADLEVPVAPHFRLGQFLCKQEGGFPKYLVLHESLLLKLEQILSALGARGIQADTFQVMSGFRTPYYNSAIGNETSFSCHLYGGAADIFIDRDGDGSMDDLDGDGKTSRRDAELLAEVVRELEQQGPGFWPGGLGVYGPKPHRGPFVHVDVRGWPARWTG